MLLSKNMCVAKTSHSSSTVVKIVVCLGKEAVVTGRLIVKRPGLPRTAVLAILLLVDLSFAPSSVLLFLVFFDFRVLSRLPDLHLDQPRLKGQSGDLMWLMEDGL